MRIADISIKQPVFITMVILLIVVLGVISYTRLGVDMMPEITLPIISITTIDPGVGPEEMESQVSKPIEDIVSSISGLKNITSTSAEGVSVAIAEFNLEKDAAQAATEVREKIATIRNTLPREIYEPVIDKFDSASAPIVSFTAVASDQRLSLSQVRDLIVDHIKPEIEQVDGVGSLTVLGGLEREIQVAVDTDKLNSLNIPIAQVSQAVRGENLNLPAGRIPQKNFEFVLRTKAEFEKVDELNDIIVANPGGRSVYLRDIARVNDGFKTRTAISRVNGVECISLIVRKQSGTNSVKVADAVNRKIRTIQNAHPELTFRRSTDESVFIKDSRNDVLNSLIWGALLAGLVVFFSFGDLRNTLITIIGLPVCIIGTFAVMSLLGYTINVLTLLALSLSVGLLIDDAIVVRENIFRHMEKLGKSPMQAAADGTSEVGLAVMATTLTIVAVFVPVAFTSGIAGRFLTQFGITVAAAVLISLFEAFTLAPMLSAHFFKKKEAGRERSFSSRFQRFSERLYDRLGNGYRPLLRWSITHRKSVIAITAGVFLISIFLFSIMGIGGTPKGQRPEFNLVVQCPVGSSLESTDRMVRRIEDVLHAQKEIGDVFAIVGNAEGGTDEASINVKVKPGIKVEEYQDRLRPLLTGIPAVSIGFQQATSLGGAVGRSLAQLPIQINLRGSRLDSLTRSAETVKSALADIPGLVDINTDYRSPKPEIQIQIDRERAARLGTNTSQVASVMRSLVDGDLPSKFNAGDKLIDIRVHSADDLRYDINRLSRVFIPTLRGGAVSLDQVAKLHVVNGPTQINRKNRSRQISVVANTIKGTPLNDVQHQVDEKIASLQLPAGITHEFGGQVEQTNEMFATMTVSLILGVIFVYMILGSQFGSFVQPFAIMLALPLSVIGAVLGLLLANKLFDMTAFIGLIMLMGLVTKNSILLVDYTNVLRRRGKSRSEAIIEAGSTRLRPILMTTLAMILGMIPVAMGLGSSSDFRAPIGFTIIGGLISSTLLTLLVVPVVYSILDDLVRKARRQKGQ